MRDLPPVSQAVDLMLKGELGPLLDLLAEDVEFCVAVGGEEPMCLEDTGRQPIADYLTAVGGLVSFWQIDYTTRGGRLIAWGKESFTIEKCRLEGGCEFALVFDVRGGRISRLLMVEDLPAYIRSGGWLIDPPARHEDHELAGV